MNSTKCFLCGLENQIGVPAGGRDVEHYRCERCGEYVIARTAAETYRDRTDTLPFVSAHIRQASEAGTVIELHTGNIELYAAAHKGTSVRRKVEMFLEYFARRSEHPGAPVTFKPGLDYPLFDAISSSEAAFLFQHALEAGYLAKATQGTYSLSVKGWEFIEGPTGAAGKPGRCFVAMSFSDDLDAPYFLGIKMAVEQDCQCTAFRMKELQHNGDICDRLLSEIRHAQFVVADFTEHKNGVYYEAGFARALGKEVINCCRADQFDDLHFDTNHLNHIKWTGPEDLRQKLADRIRTTITVR